MLPSVSLTLKLATAHLASLVAQHGLALAIEPDDTVRRDELTTEEREAMERVTREGASQCQK